MPSPRFIAEIETPAAIVDIPRMDANLARVADYARAHGLAWRPHIKTHKVPELAARQLEAGACGLTVATPAEAEVMASVSNDILLAYPPVGPHRLARVMALPESVQLSVGLDSAEALGLLERAAAESGRRVRVLVEIDVGMHRVGVQASEKAIALAKAIASSRTLAYGGLMFYPGQIRRHVLDQDAMLAAVTERLGTVAEALSGEGLEPAVVSGGSTPTLWRSHEIRGVTEIRPGTFIFNDRTTFSLGACDWDDCAYSVLATVVSTAVPGQAVIDAGAKSLAREELPAGPGGGFGALLDQPSVVVKGLSEEHGILDLQGSDWQPKVGDRVRVVPNHVCVSVNLQETLYGVTDDQVTECWPVAARRRSPL